MPAAPVNRASKRQRTLPQMMEHMMNPMMMNPMMGGMMNPMMGGGMAPMMMAGCNGMMGPMNGMMGGMMNPAAMRRMMEDVAAGEDAEEEVHDYDDVGAVQDAPPPQPAAASASVVAQPVAPAVPVPAQPEHQPPPVLPYNKSDDAAITRSASMIRGLGWDMYVTNVDMMILCLF